MRMSSILTFFAGLAVAGGSALLAREFLESKYVDTAALGDQALVEVIVASQDIAFGQVIEGRHLTTISWPREAVPKGTFSDYEALLAKPGDPVRSARRAISQGELILASKVSGYGEKVTIVQSLKPNHRAMAIKVSAETAVGGFVTPGDFVDVILTQGRNENLRTVTILQNARVIGVDQDADATSDAPEIARTVTLEVSAEESQRLALAQNAGTLSLTLRTFQEAGEDLPLQSIKLSDVLQEQAPTNVASSRKTIVVRRGTDVTEIEIR